MGARDCRIVACKAFRSGVFGNIDSILNSIMTPTIAPNNIAFLCTKRKVKRFLKLAVSFAAAHRDKKQLLMPAKHQNKAAARDPRTILSRNMGKSTESALSLQNCPHPGNHPDGSSGQTKVKKTSTSRRANKKHQTLGPQRPSENPNL